MMNDNVMIDVQNVTFSYVNSEDADEHKALKNISLGIETGSFVGIIGGNGSGKSTLSRMFNALNLPDDGDVVVLGMNTKSEELTFEIRKTCGSVFQNPDNQIVSSTVEEDVAFGPENIGIKEDEIRRRVDWALSKVSMENEKRTSPLNLSGGQKQRVAIAGILAMNPKCIILDEPTSMLDPVGRKEIMEILKQLNADGITIVIITHFPEETVLCDKLFLMSKGEVLSCDTPKEIYWNQKYESAIRECNVKIPYAVRAAKRLVKAGHEEFYGVLTIEEIEERC